MADHPRYEDGSPVLIGDKIEMDHAGGWDPDNQCQKPLVGVVTEIRQIRKADEVWMEVNHLANVFKQDNIVRKVED